MRELAPRSKVRLAPHNVSRWRRSFVWIGLPLLLLLASACENGDSRCRDREFREENFLLCVGYEKTSSLQSTEIGPVMTVTSTADDSAVVRIEPERHDQRGPRALILSEGEAFVAAIADERLEAGMTGAAGAPVYEAAFEGIDARGDVEIVFERRDDVGVLSRVELPSAPAPLMPRRGDVFDFGDQMTIRWVPADSLDRMTLRTLVTCERVDGRRQERRRTIVIPDVGRYEWDLSALGEWTDPDIDRSVDCTAEVSLERATRVESLPDYAETSSSTAVSQRTVEQLTIRFERADSS